MYSITNHSIPVKTINEFVGLTAFKFNYISNMSFIKLFTQINHCLLRLFDFCRTLKNPRS